MSTSRASAPRSLPRRHFLAQGASLAAAATIAACKLVPSAGLAAPAAPALQPPTPPPLAPPPLPEWLEPQAMQADLALLGRVYALLHPGLLRYLPEGGFGVRIAQAQRWAGAPRSPGAFYLALARLTAAVRCGHSHPNPFNQSARVQAGLLARADRLPLCAQWLDGAFIVTDPLGSGVLRGTQLLEIDGVPAATLFAQMLPLTRADGSNDGKRAALLGLYPGERFSAFDVFRSLLHPAATPGGVGLRVRLPDGRRTTLDCATLADGARGVPAREDRQHGWRFAIDADGIGRLTMPDWALYNSRWDWRAFLDSCVDALVAERARGLIVDVRANEGGLDCGDVLLARLIGAPVAEPGIRRLVRFRETPLDLRPVLDTWDASFHSTGIGAAGPDAAGFYELGNAAGRTIEPRGPRFAGRVAVLVSPVCSSATFGFARLVRQCGAATLVGQTTGGNRRGINGGRYFFLRLPGTGFEVDVPLVGYFPTTPEPDAGIVPDLVVPVRRDDLAAGRDRALEQARRVVSA